MAVAEGVAVTWVLSFMLSSKCTILIVEFWRFFPSRKIMI